MDFTTKIKTVYDLKYYLSQRHPESHFFDRDTLKFFGQTMRDFYLYRKPVEMNGKMCFELRSTTHPPFSELPKIFCHYFDVETLEEVH